MVGNHKGVHRVVLGQVGIGFLELPHLFGIQDVDFPLKLAKAAIFPEGIDQTISVDRGGLQANHHITELHGTQCRHNSLCQQFSTTEVILHGKTGVFAAVGFHQVGDIVPAAHINAYKQWIHNFHLPAWRFQASRF